MFPIIRSENYETKKDTREEITSSAAKSKSLNSVSVGVLEQVTSNVTAEAKTARSNPRAWSFPFLHATDQGPRSTSQDRQLYNTSDLMH